MAAALASPDEGEHLVEVAEHLADQMREAGTKYDKVGARSSLESSDCSGFVYIAASLAGYATPYAQTDSLPKSEYYDLVKGKPQEGDIMLRDGHMGIYTGPGKDEGLSMGNSGPKTYSWNGGNNGAPPNAYYRTCVPGN